MGLFNNQERMNRLQAVKATPSQPVQEIEMIVEYFDKTVDSIFRHFQLRGTRKIGIKFIWNRSEYEFSISDSTVFYQPSMGEEGNLSDKIRIGDYHASRLSNV